MKLNVIALAAILLALYCCESTGYSVLKEQPAKEGFAESLKQYWSSVSTQITDWYERAASSSTGQYLKGAFNNGTAAINTYTRILVDQLMHSV
ncbi:apolipoprotein C-II-like [Cetorhinus maximus]